MIIDAIKAIKEKLDLIQKEVGKAAVLEEHITLLQKDKDRLLSETKALQDKLSSDLESVKNEKAAFLELSKAKESETVKEKEYILKEWNSISMEKQTIEKYKAELANTIKFYEDKKKEYDLLCLNFNQKMEKLTVLLKD